MKKHKLDLHVHTQFSADSVADPEAIIASAKEKGLDGIAITDHNTSECVDYYLERGLMRPDGRAVDGFLIVPGQEITTSEGHLLALGVHLPYLKGVSPAEAIDIIHRKGGIAVPPHPYDQLAAGDLRGVNVTPSHEPAPCALLRDRGGRLEAEDVPESLGATPLYEHAFHVPAGVYRKFSTDYGVHATLGANQPIVFEVWCDERLLFQDVRRAGEAAGSATLDWPGDGTLLRLVATVGADAPVKRINGRPVSFAGHAVWGRPRLGCE